jgi:hypothetical protein
VLAVNMHKGTLGLAWLSMASGEFKIMQTSVEEFASELERLKPAELVFPDDSGLNIFEQVSCPRKNCRPGSLTTTPPNWRSPATLARMIWPVLVPTPCRWQWAPPVRCWNTSNPPRA